MKKEVQKLIYLLSCMLIFTSQSSLFANNLQLTAGSRPAPYTQNIVVFSVAWDNSWNVSGIPSNHDAVWLFVKFRQCGLGGIWNHALLSTTMGDHTLGPDIAFAQNIVTTDRLGNAGAHNTGAMVRRNTIGKGNIAAQTCTLRIVGSSNGVVFDPLLEYDIAVFGIEMVEVKQGEFYAGDGDSYTYTFSAPPLASIVPYRITAENAIAANLTIYSGNYKVDVPAAFPKGYDTFYCMKYEITQGQYADFLNTMSSAQSTPRYYSPTAARPYYMYNLQNTGTYTANAGVGDFSDRAMNYMSYNDLLSYLDWAALRPMTELEFEKACRGPLDYTPNEYVWGTSAAGSLIEARNVSGAPSGVEVCTDLNANCHYNSALTVISTGSQFVTAGTNGNNQGPMAVGIFARDATQTRITTGATYYGIMEMSGNVWEQCVQPSTNQLANSAPSTYTGTWGDGQLSAAGLYDTPLWPPASSWYAYRGGGWDVAAGSLNISDRGSINNTNYNSNGYSTGGRGVR